MIRYLIERWKLFRNPPKKGDTFFGDSLGFFLSRGTVERVLHGTISTNGEHAWEPIIGVGAYKLTIEADSMPYYQIKGELLAQSIDGSRKEWIERNQPLRIDKKAFKRLILGRQIISGISND